MNASTLLPPTHRDPRAAERVRKLFARVRHKQLQSALAGDIRTSARYADRALRVRSLGCPDR